MPDVIIKNETEDTVNIAFRFVAPVNWRNVLGPGQAYTAGLASVLYTIEVRIDQGHNRFSAQGSIATASDISIGWLAGAASVVLDNMGGVSRIAAAPLMYHAIQAGGRFAQNADGMVVSVGGVFIPFHNKTFAIRFNEDTGYTLWDVDSGTNCSSARIVVGSFNLSHRPYISFS